jgi:hypothetical protein
MKARWPWGAGVLLPPALLLAGCPAGPCADGALRWTGIRSWLDRRVGGGVHRGAPGTFCRETPGRAEFMW